MESRFVQQWTRPGNVGDPVTLVFRIVTPIAAVFSNVDSSADAGVVFIPPASTEGAAIETSIFLERAGLPGQRLLGTHLVGRFPVGNEFVTVVYRTIEMPPLKLSVNRQRYFHGRSREDLNFPPASDCL
jgi:hypothetical protein